jgi:hypothetical protein
MREEAGVARGERSDKCVCKSVGAGCEKTKGTLLKGCHSNIRGTAVVAHAAVLEQCLAPGTGRMRGTGYYVTLSIRSVRNLDF